MGITASLALDPCFFSCRRLAISLRSPGDRVRSTLIVNRISRFLLSAKLRYYMQAYIHFDGSIDRPLAKALIGEGSEDADLLISEILQHLAAMRTWHFFYFVALVTD